MTPARQEAMTKAGPVSRNIGATNTGIVRRSLMRRIRCSAGLVITPLFVMALSLSASLPSDRLDLLDDAVLYILVLELEVRLDGVNEVAEALLDLRCDIPRLAHDGEGVEPLVP